MHSNVQVPNVPGSNGIDLDVDPVADVLSGPVFGFVAIPPSTGTPLASPTRGILITASGNLSVVLANGTNNNSQTFPVVAGAMYPFCVTQLGSNNSAGVLGLN